MKVIKYLCAVWVGQLKMLVFTLRLKVLGFYYKGAGNIPAAKLPKIMSFKTTDEEAAFYRLVKACGYTDQICAHYKLQASDTQLGRLFRQYLRGEVDKRNNLSMVMLCLKAEHPAVAIFEALVLIGDISQSKKNFFGPPPPFATIHDWLLSLEQPYVLKVEGINT